MRIAFLLVVTLALNACAQDFSRFVNLRRVVGAELAAQRACLRLPDGDWLTRQGDTFSLRGFGLADGSFVFPDGPSPDEERVRRTFDLLAELGLFTIDEQRLEGPRPRKTRRYHATPLGRPLLRRIAGGRTQSSWTGLCYGNRVLIAFVEVGRIIRAPCTTHRYVMYDYRYANLPGWVEDPRLPAFFPDLIGRREMDVPRRGSMTLLRNGSRWYLGEYDPIHSNCVEIEEPNTGFAR